LVLDQRLPQATAPQHPHVPPVPQSGGQSTHPVRCVCMYVLRISKHCKHEQSTPSHTKGTWIWSTSCF